MSVEQFPGAARKSPPVEVCFEMLTRCVGEAALLVDVAGRIVDANDRAVDVCGWPREEMLGRPIGELRSGTAGSDVVHRRKDGSTFPAEVTGHEFEVDGRRLRHEVVRDVSATRKTEAALRESERKLAILLANLPGLVYRCANDPSWTMEIVSEGCQALTGYAPEDLVANRTVSYEDLIHPDDRAAVRAAVEAGLAGRRAFEMEYRIRHASGRERWVWERGVGVYDRKGSLLALEGFITDISARVALEGQLHQSQKMEAVGRLAGGVAHDFNNLLTVINGYAEMVLDRLSASSPLLPAVTEIKKAGVRAASVTQQLLAFSRRQVLQPRVLAPNDVVGDAERMLRRILGEDVELSVRLDPAAGFVRVDPGQIQQVVLNLVVNARDAMPHGGRLTLATGVADMGPDSPDWSPDVPAGRYSVLSVADTGTGMDPQVRSRIFEPFFSTKEPGKGTGLGLSTVFGIVRQSGGHVTVDSAPGAGAIFRVYLPQVPPPSEVEPPSAEVEETSHEGATILVVEDQPDVRGLVCSVLRDRGYRVLESADGDSALALLEKPGTGVDLVVTDLILPGLSGRDMIESLRRRGATPRVIFMSGHTDDALGIHAALDPGTAFLRKPFRPSSLVEAVRRVLSSR